MRDRFPEIFQLSFEEKFQLAQELWEDIAADPENIPIPEWQLEELARRVAKYRDNPTAGSSWEEVKERILSRHAANTNHPA